MKTKTTKFILKILILFPVGFGLATLNNGFESSNWFYQTFLGLVFAFGIIFWNLFDYEKFNEMDLTDFLESGHLLNIDNNDKNWNRTIDLIDQSIVILKKLEKTESFIRVEIPRKLLNSILIAKRTETGILLQIQRKDFFKFIPDNAENYRTLKKFEKELRTTAKMV